MEKRKIRKAENKNILKVKEKKKKNKKKENRKKEERRR